MVLTAILLLSPLIAEARSRPTSALTVNAVHEFRTETTGRDASIFLDVAASPDVLLAVWTKDGKEIYTQRFNRSDLTPIGGAVLAHRPIGAGVFGVRVVYDGEKFVAAWSWRTDPAVATLDLYRMVIENDGTTKPPTRVASNVYNPLLDVVWDGSELIVATRVSVIVLDRAGVLLGQYDPLSKGLTSLTVGTREIHAAWQTAHDRRGCRLPECFVPPAFVETAAIPRRSPMIPAERVTWSAASDELFAPDIAAIGPMVVVAAQRMVSQADRDDIIAFSTPPEGNARSRKDVLLGTGHSPAAAGFGRRFAFAWISGPLEGTKPSSVLSIRVADASITQLTPPLEIPLGGGFGSAYFADSPLVRPKIVALSANQFVVQYRTERGSSLALIAAGASARPRLVRSSASKDAK